MDKPYAGQSYEDLLRRTEAKWRSMPLTELIALRDRPIKLSARALDTFLTIIKEKSNHG
jgi:hypothetical protein